jgi:16S rRNA (cytosine967-C5)-methyltransferase
MSRVNPGRISALKALIAVEDGGHVEELLADFSPPKGPDRGLAWHLALGTLRWQAALDHALAPFCSRPIHKLDVGVRVSLRMGLFEAQKCRTPPHAAVHQAVEAVKVIGLRRASGMVNAVLRKAASLPLSEKPEHVLPSWPAPRWAGHSEWLKRIREPAVICLAGTPPDTLGVSPVVLGEESLGDLWALPAGSGNIAHLEGFEDGLFWVMDPAAAKVADMVIDAVKPGGSVLDTCAAPGGKSFRMAKAGLKVTATDREPSRLDLMRESLHRLQIDMPTLVHDWATSSMGPDQLFDAVLVDAPCTGLGTVRRHPEILWRRQGGDMAAMAIAQRIILKNAALAVKPGGALIYAVCSTEPEEGIAVAGSLKGWSIETSWSSVPPIADEDGFQAFILRRVSD